MAGRGSRLGLSASKEIAPLGATGNRVLASITLQRMLEAGVRRAVLITATNKQDIDTHFGEQFSHAEHGVLQLDYVRADASPDTPTSVDCAYEQMRDKTCALGFADILYQPCAGYARALHALAASRADIVLGLFPTTQPTSSDMVAFDPEGRVRRLLIKQASGAALFYTWSLAVWRPAFTEFLHDWVATREPATSEVFLGHAVQAAQRAGLAVYASVVSPQPSLDAGTPETLALARATHWR